MEPKLYNIQTLINVNRGRDNIVDVTKAEIENSDTFDMAIKYVNNKQGLNPLVLNMASDYKPGGGVETGSKAQEEDLFRRSNYYQTVNKVIIH